eukprot:403358128
MENSTLQSKIQTKDSNSLKNSNVSSNYEVINLDDFQKQEDLNEINNQNSNNSESQKINRSEVKKQEQEQNLGIAEEQKIKIKKIRRDKNLREIIIKALKCLGGGLIIKTLLTLITKKLNIQQVIKNQRNIRNFGMMCFFFSFLFNITKFTIKKLNLQMDKDLEVFIASLLSALSLFIADRGDINLIKIALYPRALEAFYNLMIEKNLIRPIKHGQIFVAALAMSFTTYCFIFEPYNVGTGFAQKLGYYSGVTKHEQELFDMGRQLVKNSIIERYPHHQF